MNSINEPKNYPLCWGLFVFLVLQCLAFCVPLGFSAEPGFRVESDGNLLQVGSPYGSHLYFLDANISQFSSYQVEIPLNDLKPNKNNLDHGSGPQDRDPSQLENTDQLVLKANELYNRGKFKEAADYVEELLRRDPKHVRGWIMKGSLMHALGQKDLARKSWQQALELEPNNPQIKNILGSYP
jgi:tetratricopeptide (TPR) repeat protein